MSNMTALKFFAEIFDETIARAHDAADSAIASANLAANRAIRATFNHDGIEVKANMADVDGVAETMRERYADMFKQRLRARLLGLLADPA